MDGTQAIASGEFEKSERVFSSRNTASGHRRAGQGSVRVCRERGRLAASSLGPCGAGKGTYPRLSVSAEIKTSATRHDRS
jgi:hypothetical protein